MSYKYIRSQFRTFLIGPVSFLATGPAGRGKFSLSANTAHDHDATTCKLGDRQRKKMLLVKLEAVFEICTQEHD